MLIRAIFCELIQPNLGLILKTLIPEVAENKLTNLCATQIIFENSYSL